MKRMIPLAVLLALLNGCVSHQDDVQNNVKPVADAEPTVITVSSDDYKLVWSGTDAVIKWNNGTSKRCHLFVSIHRNSIDTGKMRRSSLDPTFLLA